MVNRALNGEAYMLPLGGPEFWLQAELQDAMDRFIRQHFRDVIAMPRAPYPRLELSGRMTTSAGRCYPDTGLIRIATLYHRDHGIDATLLVLKHELAHWAARWRYGARIAPHGREFRAVAHELDPRITITCPPFAIKERAQRRTFRMQCPRCRRTYVRGRRDKVACRSCCDTYAGGRYDRRFRLVPLSRAE
ncbi:MAG TPA: SprT-like domain-containing protein [Dehalococcoidia bacterium]|nr:SprT-like domain-containing protein [Dehalococcoidia bacterium]